MSLNIWHQKCHIFNIDRQPANRIIVPLGECHQDRRPAHADLNQTVTDCVLLELGHHLVQLEVGLPARPVLRRGVQHAITIDADQVPDRGRFQPLFETLKVVILQVGLPYFFYRIAGRLRFLVFFTGHRHEHWFLQCN